MAKSSRVSIRKLKESDIYLNKAISFTDHKGIVVNLEKSWKEILIALITCVNSVKSKCLVEILSDLKLFNGNLLITKGYVENHSFKETDSYQIDGSNYFIMCDYSAKEYLKAIKSLCKFLEFDDKNCFVNIVPKKATEQDIKRDVESSESKLTKVVLLKDIYNTEYTKLKISGVQIKGQRYDCKNLIGAIKIIIMTDITKVSQLYSLNSDNVKFGFDANGLSIEHQMNRSEQIALMYKVCGIYNIETYEIGLIVK